jgi:hypothetical protein
MKDAVGDITERATVIGGLVRQLVSAVDAMASPTAPDLGAVGPSTGCASFWSGSSECATPQRQPRRPHPSIRP